MRHEQWIECRVYPGMFSDERAVEVRGKSYFVDRRSVRVRAGGEDPIRSGGEVGEVCVTIVEDAGHRWAVLPTNSRDSVELAS